MMQGSAIVPVAPQRHVTLTDGLGVGDSIMHSGFLSFSKFKVYGTAKIPLHYLPVGCHRLPDPDTLRVASTGFTLRRLRWNGHMTRTTRRVFANSRG